MDAYLPTELKAPIVTRWLNLTNFDGRDVVINVSKIHSVEQHNGDEDSSHPYAESRVETSCQVWHVREDIAYIKQMLGIK